MIDSAQVLRDARYRVITATRAADALKLVVDEEVDLLITDHLLKNLPGSLSGLEEMPDDMKCVDSFMSKGDGPTALLVRIATLLEKAAAL